MSSFCRQNKKPLTISSMTSSFPPLKKRKISSELTKSMHYEQDSDSNSSPSPSPTLISLTKNGIEPWWIGQRIIVKTQKPNMKKRKIINKTASMRDYNPFTKLTHIWFEQDGRFENVDLLKLDGWDVENNKICSQLDFIPNNDWIPIYYEMNEYVSVKSDCSCDYGKEIIGVIDSYDPISRRHHVKYNGGQISEWLWATEKRVKIYKKNKRKNSNINFILPPPWNPQAYCLDHSFALKSKEIEENRWRKSGIINVNQNRIMSKSIDKKQNPNTSTSGYTQILSETSDLYEAAKILCALKYFRH